MSRSEALSEDRISRVCATAKEAVRRFHPESTMSEDAETIMALAAWYDEQDWTCGACEQYLAKPEGNAAKTALEERPLLLELEEVLRALSGSKKPGEILLALSQSDSVLRALDLHRSRPDVLQQ